MRASEGTWHIPIANNHSHLLKNRLLSSSHLTDGEAKLQKGHTAKAMENYAVGLPAYALPPSPVPCLSPRHLPLSRHL